MTNGDKVINQAVKYVGVKEWTTNSSPTIDRWEARWGLKGQPWCGMFVDAMFAEAGVSDDGICHPSTTEMCKRAYSQFKVWNRQGKAPKGSLWIKCGIHTCFVIEDLGDGTVRTVEGNHNNSVDYGRRRLSDGIIIIPSAIAEDSIPKYKTEYWIEHRKAKRFLFQINGKVARWATKAARDKNLEDVKNSKRWKKYHPRAISKIGPDGKKRYYILMGPLLYYGPFGTKAKRDAAQKILEARFNTKLRPFSRKVKI